MALKKKSKAKPADIVLPTHVDWNALRKTAAYLEKAKLADYMEMMNHPWKNLWLNLLAGIARGAGIVIGGSVIGVLLVVGLVEGLKLVLAHAGGMPFIGDQLKQGIGWILEVVNQHQAAKP